MNINPQYHKTVAQIKVEHKLVEAAKKDTREFKPIYNKYYEIVFRFIYQRTGNEIISTDITSDVFFKALQNLSSYEFRGFPFSSWHLRIANNEIIKHYKKIKKSRIVKLEAKHLFPLISEGNENNAIDFRPFLLNALKELKIKDFQLIEMRFFESRPFKQIAEIVNKQESAVKMKVYRILEKLKFLLQKNIND